jgi:polyisoprenoid-binding protein YceI
MRCVIRILIGGLTLLLFAGMAHAGAGQWEIDKAHSSIYFDVNHTFVTVRGQFDEFSGSVRFDPENKDASGVSFEVRVPSINTNIEKRDKHLRSPDFFNAAKFPVMRFKSSDIRHVEDNSYIMDGELSIKGVRKKVSVPFTYLGMRDNPLKKGQTVAGFEAAFSINRLDYNVGNGQFAKMGVVGETVRILVALELLKEQ